MRKAGDHFVQSRNPAIEPIKDASGNVIGIYYVGYKK